MAGDLEGALCRVEQDYDEIAEDLAAGAEPPDYRPGVSLETPGLSAGGFARNCAGFGLWRCRIRAGLRCPLDLCRYLFVLGDRGFKLLFQLTRRGFRPEPSGSCRRCTMIGRGIAFH
jgi:hypothetical protein